MNESKGPRWIDLNVEQRAGSARAVRPRPDTWWDIVGPKGPADLEISSALGHGAERRPGDEGRHQEAILPGGTSTGVSSIGLPSPSPCAAAGAAGQPGLVGAPP